MDQAKAWNNQMDTCGILETPQNKEGRMVASLKHK